MLTGTLATAMLFGGHDGAEPYQYVVGAVFGLSMLGMLVTTWSGPAGPRTAELARARRDYLRYLSGLRQRVADVAREQRRALYFRHPDPDALWAYAMSDRLWERRPADADFAIVRVGTGPQTLATPLVAPTLDPGVDLEPVTAGALRRFLDTHSVVSDLPVCVALRAFSRVVLTDATVGRDRARALARAMVCQIATFHAPDDIRVAACVAAEHRRDWEWLKWLPHALHPRVEDVLGPRRLVATTLTELGDLLDSQTAASAAHTVVVVDGVNAGGPSWPGVTLVEIGPTAPEGASSDVVTLRVDTDGTLHSSTVDTHVEIGAADGISLVAAEAVARQLAPVRLAGIAADQALLSVDRELADLLGIPDIASADVNVLWAARSERDLLRIPIGTAPDGERVELDLKEAARGGMGPHGLIVGATGSGKSELLRSIVLALAATHPPDTLNVVLVDFKGGATFAALDRLPHTSAIITNLADELPLVDRMNDAIRGELTRRQELLRRAGNFASLRDYERARASGADLPPLPSLLLVCDEFTEMLAAKPEFIDLFLQIGRIGRSIGVHLLLATQRLEEGRLRGLEANLSYRIALRTFTASESRMVLGGATDAAELPSSPGHAFLRVGTEPPRRFKAAYVSGPYRRASPAALSGGVAVLDYTTRHTSVPKPPLSTPTEHGVPSLMDVIVDRLAGHGTPAHRVWLPPLEDPPHLHDLLGGVVTDSTLGLTTADPALRGALRVPFAEVDKPFEQRRDVAWLDLSGPAGHVAVVGAPQSGKSTVVRTLVTALAASHTPREVQVYCLDFGGGALAPLRDLPHVGGVAGRHDTALVRRIVGEMATLLAERERRFLDHGIESMATFRRMRRLDPTQAIADDRFGDVFLVVDGWATLRGEYEDLEPVVVDIATRGLGYGIHVVATATRWGDLRASMRDVFASRIELRLGDPGESMVDRRAAANVPVTQPGRGLTAEGLHLLTAHPSTTLVAAISNAWTGPAAPPVRMLPAVVPYSAMLTVTEAGERVPLGAGLEFPLGIAEADLRPVLVDFASDPHLVAYGDAECGKSSLLRSLAESITRRLAPDQARIILVDYRRSLLGAVRTEHLIGYGSTAETTAPLIESVAEYMRRRRPGPDVTPDQLRHRSWWTGPECFVLVDDYDLVATGPSHPLLPLLDHLSQARDVGLHLVLTRRAGGAAREAYEPILLRLRELGTPGLVMAGERDEGPLVGTVRPGPQPPGRGWLVTRKHGARLVQLAYLDSPR